MPTAFSSEGTCATWAFMFAGRLGFMPDREVLFGRLQPYVAVGPGILLTSQEPKLEVGDVIQPRSNSDVNVALVADCGIRYMVLSNVFLDVFFRYRYAQPSSDTFFDPHIGQAPSFTLKPDYHQFSGNVGVGIV